MNGIYLHFLLHEITDQLIGRVVSEVLINERFVQVRMKKKSLFISLYPDCLGIHIDSAQKNDYTRNHFFTDTMRDHRIVTIHQTGIQPVFEMQLEYHDIDRIKKPILIITLYHEAPNFSIRINDRQKDLFPRFVEKKSKPSILKALTEDPGLADELVRDNIYQYYDGIDKALARELNTERLDQLKIMIQKDFYKPVLMSVSPLHISLFDMDAGKLFNSFNELFKYSMNEYHKQRFKETQMAQLVQYQKRIKSNIEKLNIKLKQAEDFEQYMHQGNMILANIDQIAKGVKDIILINPYTNKPTRVDLDPALSTQENAQKYFQLYKKQKRSIPRIKQKIEQLKADLKNTTLSSFKPVFSKITERPEKSEPFRVFRLDTGSIVYVGKNRQSNDELTFAFARPNDYFFHVRGYEGAHVILRHETPKGQYPSHHDIRKSAEIAAHFSKAKTQKKVPVCYTQKKYLKKGKKSGPGIVIMLREQVIFVDPVLPEA